MTKVKVNFSIESIGEPQSSKLPKDVVNAKAAFSALEPEQPLWEVVIHEVDVLALPMRSVHFYGFAVVGACDHPDVMESRRLYGPIPTDGWFRAFIRLARVGRDQDLHVTLKAAFARRSKRL